MVQFLLLCMVSALLLSPVYISHDTNFRFNFRGAESKKTSTATTVAIFSAALIVSVIISMFMGQPTKTTEDEKDKTMKTTKTKLKSVDKDPPEKSGKKNRDVAWMELLTLESRCDSAFVEEDGKHEDPPCKDEMSRHPKPKTVRRKRRSRPSVTTVTPAEQPVTMTSRATEDSSRPGIAERDSYIKTADRTRFRHLTPCSSILTLNSDIYPVYTMKTLNITYARPSVSETIFDRKYKEIHSALESICNSDDMETASMIASTIVDEQRSAASSKKRRFCKGENFNQTSNSIMLLTAFLIMTLVQITKKLNTSGDHRGPSLDPKVILKQIQAITSQGRTTPSRWEAESVKSYNEKNFGTRSRGDSQQHDTWPALSRHKTEKLTGTINGKGEKLVKIVHDKGQKLTRNLQEQGGKSAESIHEQLMNKQRSFSGSKRYSADRDRESIRSSRIAGSVTSVTVSDEPIEMTRARKIMRNQPKRENAGRRRSQFAKFLEKTPLPSIFSNRKMDTDETE